MGLFGGVDFIVVAFLLYEVIGDNLVCIFVDNGLLCKDEFEEVFYFYKDMGLCVVGVDVKVVFYKELKGVFDLE